MPIKELRLDGLSAGYGDIAVTHGISLQVQQGEIWGVLGRNGAGKTTTVSAIVGLCRVFAGQVRFDGVDIGKLATYERSRMGLGYVPQGRQIFQTLSVEENIVAAAGSTGKARALEAAYDLFPRLKERRRNGGDQLSGGEQQMLAIARALATFPSLLLLDEPLEGLAPLVREEVMQAVQRMVTQFGMGCVLVEQYVDVVLQFCGGVLVMESGAQAFLGSSDQLQTSHQDILESAIGLKQS